MELYFYDKKKMAFLRHEGDCRLRLRRARRGTSSVPTPEWKVGEKIRRRTSKCLKNYYNFIKRVEFFSVLRKQNSFGTVFEATMFGTVLGNYLTTSGKSLLGGRCVPVGHRRHTASISGY